MKRLLFALTLLLSMTMHSTDIVVVDKNSVDIKELRELGAKIIEQENLIFLLDKRIHELKKSCVELKKQELSLTNLSKQKLIESVESFEEEMEKDINNAIQQFLHQDNKTNIQDLIKTEIFLINNHYAIYKFTRIRYLIENYILADLVKQWSNCCQNIK